MVVSSFQLQRLGIQLIGLTINVVDVHLQILLNLPPIAALTKVQAEVQKALKLFLTPDSREENVVVSFT